MKAVAYRQSLPIDDPEALLDCELPDPVPGPQDLLVRVRAIAVNPVDCKIRKNVDPEADSAKILGWDAAGEVVATGHEVTGFAPGDRVFYAGDLTRPGCNAEYQTVDARIVGRMPESLDFAQAAALPLTSITAWELIFDRLCIPETLLSDAGTASSGASFSGNSPVVIVTGAAGGVGSIAVQLLKKMTHARVVATASRQESKAWLRSLGVDEILDHGESLVDQYQALKLPPADYVLSLTHTDTHYEALIELMNPQAKFGLIDDPLTLDIKAFKRKSLSLHWEFMYTRSMFGTQDMAAQQELLNRVGKMFDQRLLRTTMKNHFGEVNAENLRKAHAMLESHQSIGKIVLSFSGG